MFWRSAPMKGQGADMKMRATWAMREGGPDSALNGRRPVRQMAAAAAGDDVRWERVARLKAKIEAGTYGVSSAALADRLIEHMLRAGEQGPV